jgi:tRNA nucleotidyltransferase/poly(A) polymerase
MHHYFERHEEAIAPPPLIDGHDLMDALDLPEGPEIGRLLRILQEAQAAGEIETRQEALEWAARAKNAG